MKGNPILQGEVKIHGTFLKIFSRTSRPISMKLTTNILSVREFRIVQIKGHAGPLQMGDN
jgi:hypothetical protein